MRWSWRRVITVGVAAVVMLAVVPPVAMELAQASRWRVPAGDRALVDRTFRMAVADLSVAPAQYRRMTSPSVFRAPGQRCVALVSRFDHGGGTFQACYDERTGKVLETRASGADMTETFGDWYRRVVLRLH